MQHDFTQATTEKRANTAVAVKLLWVMAERRGLEPRNPHGLAVFRTAAIPIRRSFHMELAVGLEPTTCGLQIRCSTD